MKVLAHVNKILKPLIDPTGISKLFIIFTILFLPSLLVVCVATVIYMSEHISELTKITDPIHVMVACSLSFFKWLTFLKNRKSIQEIVCSLQSAVDRSEYEE